MQSGYFLALAARPASQAHLLSCALIALHSPTTKFDAAIVGSLPGPQWLRQPRLAAWERFSEMELPSEAEEIRRYSRIGDLELARYAPVTSAARDGSDGARRAAR